MISESRCAQVLCVAAWYSVLSPPGIARAEDAWQRCEVKKPAPSDAGEVQSLEKRAVPGSKFLEYRVVATSPVPPEQVLKVLWAGLSDPPAGTVKKRQILSKSATEIVFYDEVATPVVSDRDYTLRITQSRDEKSGTIHVRFALDPSAGPPPRPNFVRIANIRGSWDVEPQGSGSRLTYLCFSEPGGSVPAFMVRGAQQEHAVKDVRRVLNRIGNQMGKP